ncbi:hypothetical protein [Alsobacter sp. R-9]
MIRTTHLSLLAAAAAIVTLATTPGHAQNAGATPHVPGAKTIGTPASAGRPIPSLAVINAAGARLDGGKLVLTGVMPTTIVFADRPYRAAGHETTKQFIMQWDEGKDSFAKDPPNATVSVLGSTPGDVADAVVTLKTPRLDGTTLTFDVAVLEGSLAGASGPVALFIDAFAARGAYGGGVAHWGGVGGTTVARAPDDYRGGAAYYHPPVYHGAWYAHPDPVYGVGAGVAAGAMVGAAAAAAAPRPACGYYPYPPCY